MLGGEENSALSDRLSLLPPKRTFVGRAIKPTKPSIRPLTQEFKNQLSALMCVSKKKHMPVIESHQPRIRDQFRQNASVRDWHDWIIGPRHDQCRLRDKAQPRQTTPAQSGDHLEVVAIVA